MTITHGMSLLSIEEQDREAASRIEEAQAMEERTARPGPSCSAALKLNGVKRPRAAADDQPLNAGLHASQLCDNRCVLAALLQFHDLCLIEAQINCEHPVHPAICRGVKSIAPAMQAIRSRGAA